MKDMERSKEANFRSDKAKSCLVVCVLGKGLVRGRDRIGGKEKKGRGEGSWLQWRLLLTLPAPIGRRRGGQTALKKERAPVRGKLRKCWKRKEEGRKGRNASFSCLVEKIKKKKGGPDLSLGSLRKPRKRETIDVMRSRQSTRDAIREQSTTVLGEGVGGGGETHESFPMRRRLNLIHSRQLEDTKDRFRLKFCCENVADVLEGRVRGELFSGEIAGFKKRPAKKVGGCRSLFKKKKLR